MKKTQNISLAGYSFIVEEDAYAELDTYIRSIRNAFEGDANADEIASDIEERIAELLSEKCKNAMVVDLSMVKKVSARIGDPEKIAYEDAESIDAQKRETAPEEQKKNVRKSRRLYRNIDERVFGGVCSGIGTYFGTDKVLIRLIFIIAFFISFIGTVNDGDGPWFMFVILAYICLWIAMPAARTVEQKCRMKGKPMNLSGWKDSESDLKRETREIMNSPAGKTFTRAGGVFLGILMLLAGCGILLGSIVIPSIPELLGNVFESYIHERGVSDDIGHMFMKQIFTNHTFWWIMMSVAVIMGIWSVYNGIMLSFDLKAPKWKPGLLLFLAWIFSIMAAAGLIIKQTADFLPTITL